MLDINLVDRKGNSHIFIGDKDCWGKGYATEAYNLLLDHVFCERAFHRIGAHVLESNHASIALHKKCGFNIIFVKNVKNYMDINGKVNFKNKKT